MKEPAVQVRGRNPFRDTLVSELIEDPVRYQRMFSEHILVGETLQVFQPGNVVLTGPQGSGKSMILNLVKYSVLSRWIDEEDAPPTVLGAVQPYFGLYVNLVRANFHIFGRRSVQRAVVGMDTTEVNAVCAADYLTHFLFHELVKGLMFLQSPEGEKFAAWLGVDSKVLKKAIAQIESWDAWFGYYAGLTSLPDLFRRSFERLNEWRRFLNANVDEISDEIWETKASMEQCLHLMGQLMRRVGLTGCVPHLFVVIDQYEALPELNARHGPHLQRIVNSLIKGRDPCVSYKIGARTHDWGRELRIWGAQSRIEVQRDYSVINLSDLLMRNENNKSWLFSRFARDVAMRRMADKGYALVAGQVEQCFGKWNADNESRMYIKTARRLARAVGPVPEEIKRRLLEVCGRDPSPLDLRLAGAWFLQQRKRGVPQHELLKRLGELQGTSEVPWRHKWWRKERVGVALLQLASRTNQRRLYYGWKTIVELSGANITAFLLLCAEVWDNASKLDMDFLAGVPEDVQSNAVYDAAEKWRNRDRNENVGGRERYEILTRLGFAIHETLINDYAMSNPGHSGFSIREADFRLGEHANRVLILLQNAVSWAILEERTHTSKQQESARRKYYLHPILSPVFAIPHTRVKEPLYASIDDMFRWFFSTEEVKFRHERSSHPKSPHQQGFLSLT
jgi:hypothetical protein